METTPIEFNYSDLGLKVDNSYKTINWNGHSIEIFNYLPIEYKYDLVMITLQEAKEDGYYSPLKLDLYFHVNLFLLYVRNINVSEEEKADKVKLYNELVSSGLMDTVIENIEEREYNEVFNYLAETRMTKEQYGRSAAALVKAFIEDLPGNAEKAMDIIKDFNPDQMKELINLADTLGVKNDVKTKLQELVKNN